MILRQFVISFGRCCCTNPCTEYVGLFRLKQIWVGDNGARVKALRNFTLRTFHCTAASTDQFHKSDFKRERRDLADELRKRDDPSYIDNRKDVIRQANQKFKAKRQDIIRDIKETKQQMRERVDKIIMSENVWTIPNLLCVVRIAMSPVLGYMVINQQYGPALGLFVVAGVTDLLDGWIARVVPGQSSVIGSFLDPMADKILVGVLFISLTYMDLIPVALTGLIIARDSLLIAAGFYIRYQSLDPPRTMARYFNVTHPTAQLAPTFISKVNTGIQLGLVGATLVSTVIPYELHSYFVALWFSTATTTVASGLSYIFVKDTYKFLRKKPKSQGISRDERSGDKDEFPPQA